MFEILLSLCLAANPGACRTERRPGGETRSACTAAASRAAAEAAAAGRETPQSWPCVPAGQTPRLALTEIAPGILVHNGAQAESNAANRGGIANLGAVIGSESVAVIDTGGSAALARDFLAAIRAVTDLPIRHAILTHMHPDHALGTSVFAAEGAEIVGHARLSHALAARAAHYIAVNTTLIGPAFAGTEVQLPDTTVADSREIDLGGRVLLLEAHPTAHTDNDLTVLDRATGTWFLGDLLFAGHLPVVDGSVKGWIALDTRLAARPAARVVPGHGPVMLPWPLGGAPQRAYLAALAADARAAVAAGTPIGDASATIGRKAAEGWLLTDLFAPRNALTAYTEFEWE
ncbi:MAG: quinoprotein relay system zinc metallohydrolase 2 [Pseudomonadota bacterium]